MRAMSRMAAAVSSLRSAARSPTPGRALSPGQILQGRKAKYQLLEPLKESSVFKAQVLGPADEITPDLAVVKTAAGISKRYLLNELRIFSIPNVEPSRYIRNLLDVVAPHDLDVEDSHALADNELCLVFPFMQHDLRAVPPTVIQQNPDLPKIIAKSVLSALRFLYSTYNGVHADVSPNNVFLSDIHGPSPVVKLGDLGEMILSTKNRKQCLECRAPEVWSGFGCFHISDVWSVGITLVHWLMPATIFGARDLRFEATGRDPTSRYCIAKIQRLLGPIEPPFKEEYEDDFRVDELMSGKFEDPETGMEEPYIRCGTLQEELEKLNDPKVPPELIVFILHLLVVDFEKRPTALEALQHSYLQSLC